MLQLVGAPVPATRELRRIGFYALDADLERYVVDALRARWPRLAITYATREEDLSRLRPQLWLSAAPVPARTHAPALWLDGIGTDARVLELGPGLWRLPAPVTAVRLVHAVEQVLAA